jgi:hypothetical protein
MSHTTGKDGPAEGPERTYLVEHYWPGITAAIFSSAAERVRTAAEAMASNGAPIRFLHSTMVPADEAAFCVFEAPSAELIEQVYARAAVRFERIVPALEAHVPTSS